MTTTRHRDPHRDPHGDQRSTLRRVADATPVSGPAGLAALAVLTDPAATMPAALRWTVLAVLGVLIVGDLLCGGLALADRRSA